MGCPLRAEPLIEDEEIAAAVLQPHFDAVRDTFAEYVPRGEREGLEKLRAVKFIVDPKEHDTPRHFAATRSDGALMIFAPQIVELPVETLVAILAHEFGHAADFAYPASWIAAVDGPGDPAIWIGDSQATKRGRQWHKLWWERTDNGHKAHHRDQIEWAADSIVQAVTGKKLGYCGDCMLQCWQGGRERPEGLR